MKIVLFIMLGLAPFKTYAQVSTIIITEAEWSGKDVKKQASDFCNTKDVCNYKISPRFIGNARSPSKKDFRLKWKCSGSETEKSLYEPHDATDRVIEIKCEASKTHPVTTPTERTRNWKYQSLSAPNCKGTTEPLYRCVRGGYFDALRVIRNMIGDETAEHTAWRITSLLQDFGRSQTNLDDYLWAKEEFSKLLTQSIASHKQGVCEIVKQAAYLTAGGGNISSSKESLGIIASEGSGYAEDYCRWSKDGKSVALVFTDKNELNGYAAGLSYAPDRGLEYVIPGFIPHDDITAGYTDKLAIYKILDSKSYTIEIRKRKITGFSSTTSEHKIASFIRESRESQKLLFKILPCSNNDRCESSRESLTKADEIIPKLTESLKKIEELYGLKVRYSSQ